MGSLLIGATSLSELFESKSVRRVLRVPRIGAHGVGDGVTPRAHATTQKVGGERASRAAETQAQRIGPTSSARATQGCSKLVEIQISKERIATLHFLLNRCGFADAHAVEFFEAGSTLSIARLTVDAHAIGACR